jgi:hypothetical protein
MIPRGRLFIWFALELLALNLGRSFMTGRPEAPTRAFVAGRARANTLRAVAHDLKAFFGVVGKDPADTATFRAAREQRG